jgi:hypothetical protein
MGAHWFVWLKDDAMDLSKGKGDGTLRTRKGLCSTTLSNWRGGRENQEQACVDHAPMAITTVSASMTWPSTRTPETRLSFITTPSTLRTKDDTHSSDEKKKKKKTKKNKIYVPILSCAPFFVAC